MTIYFHGGPANGCNLMLRRAPALLRVVQIKTGKGIEFDALDQLNDQPEPGELVSIYKIRGQAGRVHLCIRGKGRAQSGWYATAEYDCLIETPAQADCVGVSWVLFAEELAALHCPELLAPDVLACARDRIAYAGKPDSEKIRQRDAAAERIKRKPE